MTKELVGKFYPVRNQENEIIGFKTITKAIESENRAGLAIFLDNSETFLFIGYAEALAILDKNKYQCLDKGNE